MDRTVLGVCDNITGVDFDYSVINDVFEQDSLTLVNYVTELTNVMCKETDQTLLHLKDIADKFNISIHDIILLFSQSLIDEAVAMDKLKGEAND